jgi:hypothetical protein
MMAVLERKSTGIVQKLFLQQHTCNCNMDVILAQPLSWTVESDGPVKQSDITLSPPHCEDKRTMNIFHEP